MERLFAIIWLRFRLIRHSVRSASGIVNLIAGAAMFMVGAAISLGLAVGFGILIYLTARSGDMLYLRFSYYVVFYSFFFFGVLFPVMFMMGTTSFAPSRFLIFPMSRRTLYGVMLASCAGNPEHLFYYPALIAVFIMGAAARGIYLIAASGIFICILAFFIVASNALVLVFQSMMKKRKIKEIIAIISFMLLIALSFIPSFLQEGGSEFGTKYQQSLKLFLRVASIFGKLLPPSLAAEGMAALHEGKAMAAALDIVWLVLWIFGTALLGYFIFTHYHLEERGTRRKRRRVLEGQEKDARLLMLETISPSFLSRELIAVAEKDLHYLFRSVIGKFNLLMIPVFMIIVAFFFARQVKSSFLGIDPTNVVLFGMLVYVTMFSNNFLFNSFAWEGSGVKSYFISPAPLHRIILGKNLAIWTYNIILFVICMIMWMILVNIPDLLAFLDGILIFSVSILTFTIIGNLTSIIFPAARDISTLRNNPSQLSIILSFLSLIFNAAVVLMLVVIPLYLRMEFLQPIFLALLFAVQIWVYSLTLRLAARLLEARKESIIENLRVKS